mmetsp:Transcript_24284/g.70071  ORF Transcript_24284/g.70071 Transcript_24284/m.70071 type:complete len:256 (+) Transcript_24284:250-1017(+)
MAQRVAWVRLVWVAAAPAQPAVAGPPAALAAALAGSGFAVLSPSAARGLQAVGSGNAHRQALRAAAPAAAPLPPTPQPQFPHAPQCARASRACAPLVRAPPAPVPFLWPARPALWPAPWPAQGLAPELAPGLAPGLVTGRPWLAPLPALQPWLRLWPAAARPRAPRAVPLAVQARPGVRARNARGACAEGCNCWNCFGAASAPSSVSCPRARALVFPGLSPLPSWLSARVPWEARAPLPEPLGAPKVGQGALGVP